jgi:hypothetical protein
MNERILDLAVKSGHIVGELPLNANEKIQLAGLEKFAELLVKECTGICKEQEEMYAMLAPTDPTFAAMTTAMTVVDKKIKEHFGVEE